MTVKTKPSQRFDILTTEEVDVEVNAVFTALATDLGRPFMAGRRECRSIVKSWNPLLQGDLDSIDTYDFARSYVTSQFFDRYFYAAELSKASYLEAQALEKFKANLTRGLVQNNYKLRFVPYGKLNTILCSASLEIAKILGEFDEEKWFSHCQHGPNATLRVKREDAYVPAKARGLDGTLPVVHLFRDYLEWNTNLKAYLEPLIEQDLLNFEVVAGNRLSFVPKKFDSLRTMMVEPTLNQFFQQGLGNYISSRLPRANLALETQDEAHRGMVRVITRFGLPIATIDWSQASDRIWLSLCQRLLPSDWFAALSDVRSPVASYKGKEYTLTMAGSMGCGFTFPLQTLLFLCLLRALARELGVGSQFVSVFGDDCICDSELLPEIAWLANELDWQMNADKSHHEGPFRESCGVDAIRGMDCRPFFIKRPDRVDTIPALCGWAYQVFNACSAMISRFPGCRPVALAQWLGRFLLKLKEDVYFVPPRFSERAGVRVYDPHCADHLALFLGYPVSPVLENYFYPYRGYHFSFVGQRRAFKAVEQEPYLLLALEGKGIPQDFKKARIALEEDLADMGPDRLGRVPYKKDFPVTRSGFVHTWTYFIE